MLIAVIALVVEFVDKILLGDCTYPLAATNRNVSTLLAFITTSLLSVVPMKLVPGVVPELPFNDQQGKVTSPAELGAIPFTDSTRVPLAFGVTLDGPITTGTTQYPAFRVNAVLQETSSSSLLFPVVNTNTVSSVLNNLYTAYKNQTVSVTQSGTTCVVTLSAASGNANAEQEIGRAHV